MPLPKDITGFSEPEKETQEKSEAFEIKKEIEAREKELEAKEEGKTEEEAKRRVAREKEIVSEPVITPPVQPQAVAPAKTLMQMEIETILSEGLQDVYKNLDEKQKKIFREKGEETASKIEKLIQKVKFRTREIINLIKKWLKFIPGVSKFFLEQEAKIKTDKIMALKEKQKK
jgi:hypothetical protein